MQRSLATMNEKPIEFILIKTSPIPNTQPQTPRENNDVNKKQIHKHVDAIETRQKVKLYEVDIGNNDNDVDV